MQVLIDESFVVVYEFFRLLRQQAGGVLKYATYFDKDQNSRAHGLM